MLRVKVLQFDCLVADAFQGGTAEEGIQAHLGQSFGQYKMLQCRTPPESAIANSRQGMGQKKLGYGGAIFKGRGAHKGQAFRHGDFRNLVATVKGRLTNGSQGMGQNQSRKLSATLKGGGFYPFQAIRQREFFQSGTIYKGMGFNAPTKAVFFKDHAGDHGVLEQISGNHLYVGTHGHAEARFSVPRLVEPLPRPSLSIQGSGITDDLLNSRAI